MNSPSNAPSRRDETPRAPRVEALAIRLSEDQLLGGLILLALSILLLLGDMGVT